MQNKVLNEVAIEQMGELIKAVKDGGKNIYKHHITLTSNGEKGYIDFISSNPLNCGSLQDLKTILGDNFLIQAYGVYSYLDSGDNDRFYYYSYITPTTIYCLTPYTNTQGNYDDNGNPVSTVPTVTWSGITISDTVTTI